MTQDTCGVSLNPDKTSKIPGIGPVFSVTIWGSPTQPHIYLVFLMKFVGVESQNLVDASPRSRNNIGAFRWSRTHVEIGYEI